MKKIHNQEEAEMLAIEALGFVAQNDALLKRFMALTGITAGEIRRTASSPGFLAGVLNFLLNHESTLLEFCSVCGKDPRTVAEAFPLLPGGSRFEP